MKPYYQEKGITIYHGDCREILPTLEPVDLVVTDPPYNVGMDYCEGDERVDYVRWSQEWFQLAPRPLILTPGMVNLALWFGLAKPTHVCAWFKPNQCSPSALGGFNVWEPILVYGKLSKRVGQDAWSHPIATQPGLGEHPCPKSLSFWKTLMLAVSTEGQIILDPFLGTGTTTDAAKQLGRRAIGIEIEERYCEITANRLRQEVLNFEASA